MIGFPSGFAFEKSEKVTQAKKAKLLQRRKIKRKTRGESESEFRSYCSGVIIDIMELRFIIFFPKAVIVVAHFGSTECPPAPASIQGAGTVREVQTGALAPRRASGIRRRCGVHWRGFFSQIILVISVRVITPSTLNKAKLVQLHNSYTRVNVSPFKTWI